MIAQDIMKSKSVRFYVLLCAVVLLVGCGLEIVLPQKESYTKTFFPIAEVKFKSQLCGPFRATLDGIDVTFQFPNIGPGPKPSYAATVFNLAPGPHTLTVTADMDVGFLVSQCSNEKDTANFTTGEIRDTPYMQVCRMNSVPIPPDWAETGTAWVRQGELLPESVLISFESEPTRVAIVWTYSDPRVRGACIALPRGDIYPGGSFGIICQSATTGYACFWQTSDGWMGKSLEISKLRDRFNTGIENCTDCHRGNNVFLFAPDDPTWQKVMRGIVVNVGASRPTVIPIGRNFTTRVEASSDNRTVTLPGGQSITYPRYIPVSGLPGWENPLPTSSDPCADACHENYRPQLILKGVSLPRFMPPRCAMNSPATNPTAVSSS